MRFAKVSRTIAQFTRRGAAKEPRLAASDFKAAHFWPTLVPKHGHRGSRYAGSQFFKPLALFGVGASGLMSCATVAYAANETEHGSDCPSYPRPHRDIRSPYFCKCPRNMKHQRSFIWCEDCHKDINTPHEIPHFPQPAENIQHGYSPKTQATGEKKDFIDLLYHVSSLVCYMLCAMIMASVLIIARIL